MIPPISKTVDLQQMKLLRSLFLSSSRTSYFYKMLIDKQYRTPQRHSLMGRTLSRVFSTCRDISFVRYMCCDEYSRTVERSMKKLPMDNGVTDSIRQMLVIFNDYSRNVVNFSPTGAITHTPLSAPPRPSPPPPPFRKSCIRACNTLRSRPSVW